MRDYRLYLKDILSAMESIEGFVEGMDLEGFQADDRTAEVVPCVVEGCEKAMATPA